MRRILAVVAALPLWAAAARATDASGPVPGQDQVDPKAFTIPAAWRLTAISVAGPGSAAADAILKATLQAHLATVQAPAARPPAADTAEEKGPTQEELDKLTVSLPYTFVDDKTLRDYAHVILYDKTGKGPRAAWHEPQWARQADLVKKELERRGVKSERILVAPVAKAADFLARIKALEGPKKVYVFGHGSPLVLHFGDEPVKLDDKAPDILNERVDMVCHYGCSFVNADEEKLKTLQAKLPEGTVLTLYGHRLSSTKEDDSPWDKENPLIRTEVAREKARMYLPRKELAAKTTQIASAIGAAVSGRPPLVAAAPVYTGEPPAKLDEPDPFRSFFGISAADALKRALDARKKLTTPKTPPAPKTPGAADPKPPSPPWSWFQLPTDGGAGK